MIFEKIAVFENIIRTGTGYFDDSWQVRKKESLSRREGQEEIGTNKEKEGGCEQMEI